MGSRPSTETAQCARYPANYKHIFNRYWILNNMKTSSIKRKPTKTTAPKNSKEKFTSLSSELTLSLKSLKLQIKESAQNWSMRLQADISHIIGDINALQPDIKKSKMVE